MQLSGERNECLWRKDNQSYKSVLLRLDTVHRLVYLDETFYPVTGLPISNLFFMKTNWKELMFDEFCHESDILPKVFHTVFHVFLLTVLYFGRWGRWGSVILGNLFTVIQLVKGGPYLETRTLRFENAISHNLSKMNNNNFLKIIFYFW